MSQRKNERASSTGPDRVDCRACDNPIIVMPSSILPGQVAV